MSDKVRWAGPRAGAARSTPLISYYVTAKVKVSGRTHIGLMLNGDCFQLCNYTNRNTILMPVADSEVECPQCKYIMRRDNITVNMSVKFEPVL